eukprot:scaffold3542_cov113-Isochrysis_galbana.AAC.18
MRPQALVVITHPLLSPGAGERTAGAAALAPREVGLAVRASTDAAPFAHSLVRHHPVGRLAGRRRDMAGRRRPTPHLTE